MGKRMTDEPRIVLSNGKTYPMPMAWSGDEGRIIKRLYGGRMPDFSDVSVVLDPDVLIAFAMIATARAGEPLTEDEASSLVTYSSFVPAVEEEGADADPPAVRAADSLPNAESDAELSRPSLEMIRAASGSQS
jgi:hypothetical protein